MAELELDQLVLRYCRQVIMQAMDYFNQQPVAHTWSYLLENAA